MTRFLPTVAKVAAASLFVSGFASTAIAEGSVSYDVTMSFDRAQLTSTTGASTVLADLNEQARDACRYVEPILRSERVDQDCVADIVRQSVIAINETPLTEAYNIAEGNQVSPAVRAASFETAAQ